MLGRSQWGPPQYRSLISNQSNQFLQAENMMMICTIGLGIGEPTMHIGTHAYVVGEDLRAAGDGLSFFGEMPNRNERGLAYNDERRGIEMSAYPSAPLR